MAHNWLKKHGYRVGNAIQMKKHRGRQLATQVIIEPHFGADFFFCLYSQLELTTFHAKKAMEVLLFYRIRGIENWKPNHWFSMYFDYCGCAGCASYSMIYGEAQQVNVLLS